MEGVYETLTLLWSSHLLSKWMTLIKRQEVTHILIGSFWYLTICLLVLRAADAVLTGLTENIIAFHMKNISNSKDKAHLLLVRMLTLVVLGISTVNGCVLTFIHFSSSLRTMQQAPSEMTLSLLNNLPLTPKTRVTSQVLNRP